MTQRSGVERVKPHERLNLDHTSVRQLLEAFERARYLNATYVNGDEAAAAWYAAIQLIRQQVEFSRTRRKDRANDNRARAAQDKRSRNDGT